MLKITIPTLNNLIPDKMVEDFINEIKYSIDYTFQQINNKTDDKETTKIFQDLVRRIRNSYRNFLEQVEEYLKKFSIIGLSINITQPLLELKLMLLLYTALLLMLHAPLDNLQAKLRYHLPKIDKDNNLLYIGRLIKATINTKINNNKNMLEYLKEIIDYFKNNQILN
jgi:hypothetical protein